VAGAAGRAPGRRGRPRRDHDRDRDHDHDRDLDRDHDHDHDHNRELGRDLDPRSRSGLPPGRAVTRRDAALRGRPYRFFR
jgi:hypothetical protein